MSTYKPKPLNGLQQALILFAIFLACLFTGCSDKGSGSTGSNDNTIDTQYHYSLEGVFSQTVPHNTLLVKTATTENVAVAENLIATMSIYSHESGDTLVMDWHVTLDEDAKTLTSNMTAALPLGMYDFTLKIQDGTRNYLGSAPNITLTPETIVALAVTPVIGDVTIDYSVIELPKLKFSYPVSELTTIVDPKIGYRIDGSGEEIVALTKSTGQNLLYLSLIEGAHTIALTLYDGTQLIATSRPEQENVTVIKTQDIKMDLIPLVAAVEVTTTIDGGEATFILNIPVEVVDEAGSLTNLKTIFKLVSPRNGLIEDSLAFVLTPDSSAYTATIVLSNYYYDSVIVDVEFWDIATNEVIAHSIEPGIALGSSSQTIAVNLNLIRRAIISGNLLSFVGVNVFDSINNPVAGATITLNDTIVGITGSGIFGTPGFLSFYSTAGSYTLRGENNGASHEIDITLSVLGTSNQVLKLESPFAPEIIHSTIATGDGYSLFLKDDGTLWASGSNNHGQLGDGTTIDKLFPVHIMSDVQSVAADDSHTLILKNDHTLWTTGYNLYGQLGDGTTTNRSTPVQIMTDVQSISAGSHHSLIVKNDNTLWATGWNNYGQLGDGTLTNRSTPVQIMTDVRSVSAGAYHSLIIKTDNTLWASGRNDNGQLGDGTTTQYSTPIQIIEPSPFTAKRSIQSISATQTSGNILSVSTGEQHSLILTLDNTLWATGLNDQGQLGNGTTTNSTTLTQIMSGVQSISAGSFNSLIVKTDNTLWATGLNDYGQLGNGTTTNTATPLLVKSGVSSVASNGLHSLIKQTDNSLLATGQNSFGQFGNGTTFNSSTFIAAAVAPSTVVTKISSGNTHTLFLKADNSLWATGKNDRGQLGDTTFIDKTTPVLIATDILTFSAAGEHSVFVKTDNTLWTFGYNMAGQLGDTTLVTKSTPTHVLDDVQSVTTGWGHNLMLKTDNTLWVNGSNYYGALGLGHFTDRYYIEHTMDNIQAVFSGVSHSLFLKTDNTLWATGYNDFGQFGNGVLSQRNHTPIQIMTNVKSASAGVGHTMILKNDNTLWGAGYNPHGQLGDGNSTHYQKTFVYITSDVRAVAAGGHYTLILKNDNSLWATGNNMHGQLGDGTTTDTTTPIHVMDNVKDIETGKFCSFAIKFDNSIWVTGQNIYGQFGDGTTTSATTFINITP